MHVRPTQTAPLPSFTLEYLRVTFDPALAAPCAPEQPRERVKAARLPESPLPPTQCLHPPSLAEQGAPQGKGLIKNADGSVQTAGGYKIAAEGADSAWKIYDPQGKELTRVWGDPHVSEGDGTRWDFTKSSNFILPDGTRIAAKTSGETGQTVTTALDIAHGLDRVQIAGIDGDSPTTGAVTGGGVKAWQAEHGVGKDSFALHHDAARQDWVKTGADGRAHGVVTGAREVDGSYEQLTSGAASTLPGGGAAPAGFGPAEALAGPQAPIEAGDASALMAFLSALFGGAQGFGGLGHAGQDVTQGYGALAALRAIIAIASQAESHHARQLSHARYDRCFR